METLGKVFGSTRITLKPAKDAYEEALTYQNQGNFEQAGRCYEEALRIAQVAQNMNPDRSKVNRTLAQIYLDYGQFWREQRDWSQAKDAYQQAKVYADKARTLKPSDVKIEDLLKAIEFKQSQLLLEQGETAQANQLLEQSSLLPPSSSSPHTISSSTSSWAPSTAARSHPYLTPNTELDNRLSGLIQGGHPFAQPFFNQKLQVDASLSAYTLPQPGETIQETRHLAWCIQHTSVEQQKAAWVSEAQKVVGTLNKPETDKGIASVQELVALAKVDHAELYHNIVKVLLKGLELEKHHPLSLPLLQGLAVTVFYRTFLTQDHHAIGDYITLLYALLDPLERIHPENNPIQAQALLDMLALLLDQMVYLEVQGINRGNLEKRLNEALGKFKQAEFVWPIEYIRQALARLPNDESFSEQLINKVLPILGGVSYLTTFGLKIASAEVFISGLEIDKLWDAYQCFKDVWSETTHRKCASWYGELRFIDVLIGLGRVDLLEKWFTPESAKHGEFFFYGLCDRLERMACMDFDPQTQNGALRLLKGFKEGEIAWAKHDAIKQYATQKLNRLAWWWPSTLNINTLAQTEMAPPAWHPFWSKPSTGMLFKSVQSKAEQRDKHTAMLYQINSISDQLQKMSLPTASPADLREALYKYYEPSNLSIKRVSGQEELLDKCYINLAIVESQAQREKDQAELKKPTATFERPPSGEQLEATNPDKLIPLDQLFETQKLRDNTENIPKRILIQGRAGIGKTTLCKKLVYEYYHNNLWQGQFDNVVWIPLRQLKNNSYKRLEDLLSERYFAGYDSVKARALVQAFETSREKTLFILDGLDEVTEMFNEKHSSHLFLQTLIKQTHVLITSRPAGVSVAECKKLDLELETIGFSAEDIQMYIENFAPEEDRAAIKQFIDHTPLIRSLVNIPIQLDALCFCWKTVPKDQGVVTITQLYQAMVDELWPKDVERLEKRAKGKLLDVAALRSNLHERRIKKIIASAMAPEIYYLGYLAFKGLEAGKIEFNLDDLEQYQTELEDHPSLKLDLPDDFAIDLKKTSYLHPSDLDLPESERQYHFLHLTFQEFFAAQFLAKHFQANATPRQTSALTQTVLGLIGPVPNQEELEAFIKAHKYNPRYEIVWWMVAGLLEKGGRLERFFQILDQKPRDLIGMRHQRVLLGCLSEARNQLEPKTIDGLEKELMKWVDFEMKWKGDYSQLGCQRAFPEHLLLKFLHESESKKENIIRTLEARSVLSDDAISTLVASLQTENWYAAAKALGGQKMLPDYAIRALVAMLQDENGAIRTEVAHALSKQVTLPEDASLILIAALQDERSYIWSAANYVLQRKKLSDAAGLALVEAYLHQSNRAVILTIKAQNSLPNKAIEALLEALQGGDINISFEAADVLERQEILPDSTIMALVNILLNENTNIRFIAQSILSAQKVLPDTANLALVNALKDEKNADIRSAVAEVIGGQTTLSDASSEVGSATASALGSPNKGFVDEDAANGLHSQEAPSERSMLALIKDLQNDNASDRFAASRALGNLKTIPENVVLALIAILFKKEDVFLRHDICQLLGKHQMLSEVVIKALIAALRHEKDSIRSDAAKILGQQKFLSNDAIRALIAVLQDKNEAAQFTAAKALDLHIDQLYALLSSFTQEEIQSLYTKVLLLRSYNHITPLYIQGEQLHFNAATNLEQPIYLTVDQRRTITDAFKGVQAEVGIFSLEEKEAALMEE